MKKGYAANKSTKTQQQAERFVRAWQTARCREEVAALCDIGLNTASYRAARYRKQGVPLRRFPTGRPGLDIAALRRVARKCVVSAG